MSLDYPECGTTRLKIACNHVAVSENLKSRQRERHKLLILINTYRKLAVQHRGAFQLANGQLTVQTYDAVE